MTHTFLYNETSSFTVSESITADILVVAGGGSGGTNAGGGGGAGGYIYAQNISLSQGTYSVTDGIGGTGPFNWFNDSFADCKGNNGGNSSFGTLYTAIGGGGGGTYIDPPPGTIDDSD